MFDFKYRDCDALGNRFYPNVEVNIPAFQVTLCQIELYKEGYLREVEAIDGLVGRGTLAAIEAYKHGKDDGTKPPAPEDSTAGTAAETIPVLQNVPHYSQASPLIRDILLGFPLMPWQEAENKQAKDEGKPEPHKAPDTCKKSGCLSTALWCCMASHRDEDFPAIDSFIEHLVSCECYLPGSILHQAKACQEFGFSYARQTSAYAAKNYLRDGIPIIIQIRKPHTHFLVGLGYDVMKGYACHDPGTQFGNFYKEPRYVLSEAVTRYDAVIPKETA